jgi:hypothetical protein
MDHKAFWAKIHEFEHIGMRRGQAIYNVAFQLDADITNEVVRMVGDPFYNDECNALFFQEFNRMYEAKCTQRVPI